MLGPRRQSPAPAVSQVPARTPQKRIFFVCIGNSCRSPMAGAFARKYGADIISPRSAGLSPAVAVSPLTVKVLADHNIDVSHAFPKPFDTTNREAFDLVVNMSGEPVSLRGAQVIDWPVPDPIGQSEVLYQVVAHQIEGLVMRLILDLRNGAA